MQQGEATDPRCAECQDVSAAYCNRCAPAVFDAVQSRIKVKPEGATDPPFVDRARTARAAAQTTYGDVCRWCGHQHDPEDGCCDAHAHVGLGTCPCPGEGLAVAYDKINAALYVAEQDCAELRGRLESATDPLREALERIAALRVIDGIDGRPCPGWAINEAKSIAREVLDAVPEPEWEYRVIYERAGSRRSGPCDLPTAKRYRAQYAGPVDPTGFTGSIERRRKAGEWEALPDAD